MLRTELGLPPGVEPIAYLCVGYPVAFGDRPLLEETGWRARRPLASAVHDECYRAEALPALEAFATASLTGRQGSGGGDAP